MADLPHVFVLRPPSRGLQGWAPWMCICGAGGCGADDKRAQHQFYLHEQGLWPAFTESALDVWPDVVRHEVTYPDGETAVIYVRSSSAP